MTRLTVVQSRTQATDVDGNPFVIESELATLDNDEFDEAYDTFVHAAPEDDTRVPLYRIVWKKFTAPQSEYHVRLIHLVLLYRRLAARIEADDVDWVTCRGLDPKYRALAVDVAEATGVKVDVASPATRRTRLLTVLVALAGLAVFFADQMFSLLVRPLFAVPDRMPTVFIPSMGRFHTVEHLLDAVSTEHAVIIPPMTVAWLRSRSSYPEIAAQDPIPINMTARPRMLVREAHFLAEELLPELAIGRFDRSVIGFLWQEFDVRLTHSVAYEIDEVLDAGLLRSLLYYVITDDIVERYGCETLVANSAAPMGKAMLAAGKRHGVCLYHLRHSMVTGYTPAPPFNATEFVEGPLATEHLKDANHVSDTSNFIETGFEYLREMAAERADTTADPNEPFTFFLGTQPYDDARRLAFVENVLAGFEALPVDYRVVLKTHPEESAVFYRDAVDDPRVTVVTEDLSRHLREADLAVTINSNVGLEAMLAETPCVSVNKWRPVVRAPPYALHLPVPLLESPNEIRAFFETLDPERLADLGARQCEAVREGFILDGEAADRMAEHIEGGDERPG
jgi:hypothetical protein